MQASDESTTGLESAAFAGPLAGIRVLDLTWGPAGAIATMILADYGAEVVRVDRPSGDPARRAGAFATWDRGKHRAELDLHDEADRRAVRRLAEGADIVVDGLGAGRLDRFGLGYDDLRQVNPGLVYCALSATGPELDDPMLGHDLLAAARFGVMAETGGNRPGPIFPGHPAASYATGLLAAIGTLASLRARLVSGRGDRLDVSNVDGVLALSTMEWWSERGVSFIRGKLQSNRLDLGYRALLLQHYTCADGGILQLNTAAPGAFDRAMEVFGLANRISVVGGQPGEELTDGDLRVLHDELPGIIAAHSLEHWLDVLWNNSVACLPVFPPGAVFDDDQVRHAGVMTMVDHPERGTIEVVGPVIELSASPAPPLGPIESAGQSTGWARDGWLSDGLGPVEPAPPSSAEPATDLPLAGVRVLELSSFFASPYGNRLLADLGADVVKVEAPGGDPQRSLPDPAENVNARKRSIVIDLKHEAARPVIEQLVRWADVVGHNMRPGAIERLGLGVEDVRAIDPRVIYTYGPGYGSSGPKSALQSFAPLHSGLAGLMRLAAGEGNEPVLPFGNEDYYTGLLSAVGTLLALVHRERTGVAQYVEVPQLLATVFVVSELYRADGALGTSLGELDTDQMGWSPYVRLYRCSRGWLCVSAVADDARAALRSLVGDRGDLDDDELDDEELADRLAALLAERPVDHWRTELRAKGIPCEEARNTPWLADHLSDAASMASGESIEIDTHDHGRVRVIGNLFRIAGRSESGRRVRAPLAGEDTLQILDEIDLDSDTARQAIASGAVWAAPIQKV